ncbi:MAG TPA: glycosyltransferase family 9 protein [Bryobacteraceae bacterium]|jgi:heptosyltransferase-1
MGDVIHALPAVASLSATFPNAEIVWAIDPKWSVLLEGNPHVGRVLPFNRRDWSSVRAAMRDLRATEFDFAVDFQGLVKSALLATAARPEKIYGFARGEARETPATWCYSSMASTTTAHIVDKNLELATLAGARTMLKEFPIPPGAPEGELPDGPFVLANPLAGWVSKQWPLEHYAGLAALLKIPLVLNGPPSSAGELEQVKGAHVHLSGLAGLIDATRRASAIVGVDSGPLHLAAALAKPGVAIFGPTDPARNGPYGGSIEVLRVAGAPTTYKRGASISESMAALTPEEVAARLTSCSRSFPSCT